MSGSQSLGRLNPTDATLWAIKRDPELRTTIVGIGLLDRKPEWATFVYSIERTVERIARFRQSVAEAPLGVGRPRWVDSWPDLDHHLRRVVLPEPGDRRSVLELAGALAGEDFDENRPLWQIHLVEGLVDDRAALVVKVSHSLTDGVEGMGLLRAMADDMQTDVDQERPAVTSPREATARRGPGRAAPRLARATLTASARAGRHPIRTIEGTTRLIGSAARLMAPTGQPLSPLTTGRGHERWAGVTDIPLDRLRRAAHRAGGTINDALVTIVVSAFADYHAELGSDAARFRVTLPVNLRAATTRSASTTAAAIRSGATEAGGNQWAPARLVLAVDRLAHPFAELRRHQSVLRTAIREPAIPFTQLLAAGILELPPALTTSIVGGMVKGSDIAITDVPGVTEPLTIAGSRLTRFYPFAPTGGAALNVGLVSHGDTACIGFTVDTSAISQPERLVRCFDERATDFLRRRKAPAPSLPAPSSTAADPPTERDRQASGNLDKPGIDRLSALDTSFLRLESPTTPMHMGGLFIIEGRGLFDSENEIDIEALRRYVERRLQRLPRLGKKVKEIPLELARPVWVDPPDFDIAEHVHHRTLPPPGSRAQLLDMCQSLQMRLLDRRRPLFDLTFIDGLDPSEFGPDAVALVERVHHALLDGVSGVEMVQLLFDFEPTTRRSADEVVARHAPPTAAEPGPLRLIGRAAADNAREPLALARMAAGAMARPRQAVSNLGKVVAAVTDLVKPDHLGAGPLDRQVGSRRRLQSISVPLALVHDTGSKLGGTVNDVVLTAVSRGVRQLLDSRGAPLPGSFVVLVPVSTRRLGMAAEHGNEVAALAVELPIEDDNLLTMFATVSQRMNELKADHHADGTELLLDAADHLPALAVDLVVRLVGHQRSVDMVVTNLPGPPGPLFLEGNRVREMIPVLPLGHNLTMGVAVLSYDGDLIIAFHDGDDDHDDVEVIAEATRAALLDLATTVGVNTTRP